MSGRSEWFVKHKSSNFIFLVIVAGIVLLFIGNSIPTKSPLTIFLANLTLQTSAICITTAIVTIFFNFDDVKEYMSKSIAHIWGEGQIVSYLSKHSKAKLDQEIIMSSGDRQIYKIVDFLYEELTMLRQKTLSDFMMSNYNIRIVMSASKYPNMLMRHMVSSYRIQTDHLIDQKRSFPVAFEFSINVSKYSMLTIDEIMPEFELKVGHKIFTKKDIIISDSAPEGSLRSISIRFAKDVEISNGFVDVYMTLRSHTLENNNNEVITLRYPTQGLNVSLQYSEDYEYQGCCLGPRFENNLDKVNDDLRPITNGISFCSNYWMLPGSGIVLGYYPKQPAEPKLLVNAISEA